MLRNGQRRCGSSKGGLRDGDEHVSKGRGIPKYIRVTHIIMAFSKVLVVDFGEDGCMRGE